LLRIFRTYITNNKQNNGKYYYDLGCGLEENEKWEEASQAFIEAIKIDRSIPLWHYHLGCVYQELNKWQEASQALTDAISLDSSNSLWHYQLGCAHQELGRWKQASESFRKALETNNSNALWYFQFGYALQRCNLFDDSIIAFSKAIVLDNSNELWHYELGVSFENKELWEDANNSYIKAIKLDSKKGLWHYRLGYTFQKLEKWEDANNSYIKAIKLDSKKGLWHYRLGYTFQKLEQWEDANNSYIKAIKLDPKKGLWHYRLGYTFQKLEQWEDANNSYIKAIKLDPKKGLWHYRLGYTFQKSRLWNEAITSYQNAIKHDSKKGLWHYRLGYTFQKSRLWNEAIISYKNAIKIDPKKDNWRKRLESLKKSIEPSEYGLVEEFGKDIIKGWVIQKNNDENILIKVNGKTIDKTFPGKEIVSESEANKIAGFARTLTDLWKYLGAKDIVEFEYCGNIIPIAGFGLKYVRSEKSKKESRVDELIQKIGEGYVFNKYGRFKLAIVNNEEWKESIFNLFNNLKKDLKEKFNLDLFPTYGTMLGAAREGDFISHDNDFDTSYISKEKEPEKVKNEFLKICEFLINKGYRLHVKDTHTWVYVENQISFYFKLDIFVSYFNQKDDYQVTYGYHGKSLKRSEEFFKFTKLNLSNHEILVPSNYREILKQLYGKTWEIPDPGFKHEEDTRQWDKNYHLNLTQVSSIYWKQFYKNKSIEKNSRFAVFINELISPKSNIVEIGCGSGEDALFFEKNGHIVSASDQHEDAFSKASINSNIKFSAVDAGNSSQLYSFLEDAFSNYSDKIIGENILYMRFFLHSIPKEIENIILENCSKLMKKDYLLALEFRTEKDQNSKHIYKKHYRRFIPMKEMILELKKYGFDITYSEEAQGLSPFMDEDPFLCRIIAKKL
jgi:tetratricopeptide (TPR) repeat protein